MKLARAGGGGGNKNLLFAAPRPGYIGLSAYTLFPDFMLQCLSCEAKRSMSFARESWSVPYYFLITLGFAIMSAIHDETFSKFEELGEPEVRKRLECNELHITHREPARSK